MDWKVEIFIALRIGRNHCNAIHCLNRWIAIFLFGVFMILSRFVVWRLDPCPVPLYCYVPIWSYLLLPGVVTTAQASPAPAPIFRGSYASSLSQWPDLPQIICPGLTIVISSVKRRQEDTAAEVTQRPSALLF